MKTIRMPEQIRLEGRVRVLSYSGGKDSGATWLALREHGFDPDYILCADTGWESLEWYDHVRRFSEKMGREITTVRASVELADHLLPYAMEVEALLGISPSPMVRRVIHKAMFPNRVQKWCTGDLKQVPLDDWADRMDLDDAVRITGIRADESRKRALYTVDERHTVSGHWHWRPIIDWSVGDVVDIHRRHGMPLCSLYDLGVSRVGCWPCMPARNKSEVRVLDARRINAIRRLEQIVNHLSAERRAKQGLGPTGAIAFQIADLDGISDIDTAVAHARTYRGGHRDQGRLFEPRRLDTCQRWGVCDSGDDGFSC